MSRWGHMIPHREDDDTCLCGCQDDIVGSEENSQPGRYVLSTRRPGAVSGPA